MGIFSSRRVARAERIEPRIVAPRASSPENPSTPLSNPDAWLMDWSNGGVPLFGPPVSERTAMAVSTVYRCVTLLSGLLAAMPLCVYKDDPEAGRQIVQPDVKDGLHGDGMRFLARLLGQVPFPGRPLTSFAWRELWGVNFYLWGNHFSVKRYNGAGRLIGFEPAMPWSTEVRRSGGKNVYVVSWNAGSREIVAQEDMIHISGPGFDGVRAPSRIQSFMRNAVSLARMLEEQTGRVHENAARPSGMVTVPSNISPAGLTRMEAYFNERWSGRINAGKVIFADKDSEFTPFQMTPEDLATLETRHFSIAEICRFYGVPPHLVGEAAGTSAWGSGIEQLTIGFLKYTLEADLQRIEHELNYKLLDGTPYYVMFDRDSLSSMDGKTMADIMASQINSAQLTPNEARRKQFRPAQEGGDQLFVNGTLRPITQPFVSGGVPPKSPDAPPSDPQPPKEPKP